MVLKMHRLLILNHFNMHAKATLYTVLKLYDLHNNYRMFPGCFAVSLKNILRWVLNNRDAGIILLTLSLARWPL